MFSKVPQSPQSSRAAAAPEVIEIVPIDVRVALALTGLPASLTNA